MMWSLFQELNLEGPQNWNFNVDFDFIWMVLIDDHISSTSASVTIVFKKKNFQQRKITFPWNGGNHQIADDSKHLQPERKYQFLKSLLEQEDQPLRLLP